MTLVMLDFDAIASMPDSQVYARLMFHWNGSKPPLLPRSLIYNAYQVFRTENLVTIHLLHVRSPNKPPQEVARVSFAPAPNFGTHPVMV